MSRQVRTAPERVLGIAGVALVDLGERRTAVGRRKGRVGLLGGALLCGVRVRAAVVVTTERVFVIRVRDGRAEWVDVKRGATDKDNIEVFGPLHAGDPVVARASDEIRNGTPLTVRQAGK